MIMILVGMMMFLFEKTPFSDVWTFMVCLFVLSSFFEERRKSLEEGRRRDLGGGWSIRNRSNELYILRQRHIKCFVLIYILIYMWTVYIHTYIYICISYVERKNCNVLLLIYDMVIIYYHLFATGEIEGDRSTRVFIEKKRG